jgi:hypothetical protein
MTSENNEKSWFKKLLSSYAIAAFVLLLLFEGGGWALTRYAPEIASFSPYRSANRSWVWWNVKDFEKSGAPDIVLLGSSLMMSPLHGGDAVMSGRPQNVTSHHRSSLLESELEKRFGRRYSTFAFALGGEMVSDAYVISDSLLTGKKKPKVIVYGIAPRDFMDHALPSAASTEIFKYMKRIGDLSAIDSEAYNSPVERAENYLSKISFAYKHRADFLYLQSRWAKALFRQMGYKEMEVVNSPLHVRKQAFTELPEDNGPTSLFVDPPELPQEEYVANLDEYRFRYRKINQKQFDSQTNFLRRLLGLARKENIALVLVNMPLTEDNIKLMPGSFYSDYLAKVKSLSAENGAIVIDLNRPDLFPQKYFSDSVHLNRRGGAHFMAVLAEALKNNSEASRVIGAAGH